MSIADDVQTVTKDDIELTDTMLGYKTLIRGEYAGAIEGIPGKLEYLMIKPHWQGKGAGRAALQVFIEYSREMGHETVVTNNDTHPAMRHVLETEGFTERDDEIGWRLEL